MDIPLSEPATPSIYSLSLWTAEDSGYHTSFTPGSTECSRISTDTPQVATPKIYITGQIQLDCYADLNISSEIRYNTPKSSSPNEVNRDINIRRGVKRSHDENIDTTNIGSTSAGTPTSIITGKIQRLDFNEDKSSNDTRQSLEHSSITETCTHDSYTPTLSYPTTPVKNRCTTSCNLSPFHRKKFARKVEFVIHSLSCEKKGLQPVKLTQKLLAIQKPMKYFTFKPNQKVDIINMLYKLDQLDPMRIIVSYLSRQDIYNFRLVSPSWLQAWEHGIGKKNVKKQDFIKYMDAANTNRENWVGGTVPQLPDFNQSRRLREINGDLKSLPSRSPPTSPRTTKFKKFTKAASMDSRTQLSCIHCQYPSKVTKEDSGEMWVQCTNPNCAYQFCALCKGKRHSDRSCVQYGLKDPSPSKRNRCQYLVSSKKSKKNLYRLLA